MSANCHLIRVLIACFAIMGYFACEPARAQKRLPAKLVGFWDSADPPCVSFHSEGRLIITQPALEYYETMCEVRSLSSAGKNMWTVRARCADDGGAARQTIGLRLSDNDKLTILSSGTSYQRCAREPAR